MSRRRSSAVATGGSTLNWRTRAACRFKDPELFFWGTDSPPGAGPLPWEWEAREVCWACPVVDDCLREELQHPAKDQWGVVGGMTAGQRRETIRRRARRDPSWVRPDPRVDPLTVDHLAAGVRVPGASVVDKAHAAVRLLRQGIAQAEVAQRLGVPESWVRVWAEQAAAGEPLTDQPAGPARGDKIQRRARIVEEVRRLAAGGVTYTTIGLRCGIDRGRVRRIVQDGGAA